jgi:hypothetical protein
MYVDKTVDAQNQIPQLVKLDTNRKSLAYQVPETFSWQYCRLQGLFLLEKTQ